MAGGEASEWIVVTEDAKTLPAVEILTGRGFITGKSGSGKSNSASVIAEELLENSYNMLIVDPEGEYYGLKERYELLHVGADDYCDVEVGPRHAEKLAEIALERNMPVILDVSEYFDGDEAKSLIRETVEHLFKKEKEARKPFLLVVEEMQEYLPQQGSSDELADLLERVAKRGRKRGLGVLGMSQRPASVDKDFITQCDWMVWHKLTWENDLNVASNILGSERASAIEEFETGEAFLMTDWSDGVERVKFKRKRTHDAGATPGLESYDRPDLHSVGNDLIAELTGDGETGNGDDEGNAPSPAAAADLDAESLVADVDVLGEPSAAEGSGGTLGYPDGAAVDIDLDPDADPVDALHLDLDGDVDEAALREELERMARRNLLLEDEVSELKRILEDVESVGESSPFAGNGRPAPDEADGTGSTTDSREPPARPTVPQPPPDRSGLAGNLIEFGQMLLYLGRRLKYRIVLAFRAGSDNRQRPR